MPTSKETRPVKKTTTPPPPLATVEEVAEFLGIPTKTLRQWRLFNKGPKSVRLGHHVRYRWNDVHDWIDERMTAEGRFV